LRRLAGASPSPPDLRYPSPIGRLVRSCRPGPPPCYSRVAGQPVQPWLAFHVLGWWFFRGLTALVRQNLNEYAAQSNVLRPQYAKEAAWFQAICILGGAMRGFA
jgi:hypothetical protein